MITKDLLWLLNNTKLESITFELGNLPLHIFTIEDIIPERQVIKNIRQTKSHIILDEIYTPDKIGIAFYKNKIYRYLIRCIERNDSNKGKSIIVILNDNFNKYFKLKRLNYETKWITLLHKIKDLSSQNLQFLKIHGKRKLLNNIKSSHIILTDCSKLSGTTDYAAISNNIIGDQPILLYDKKLGLMVNTNLIWYMLSLKLEIQYSDDLQRKIEEIRFTPNKTIKLNITIDDIYDLLLMENLINSV